jgi:subtilisin family serine protease
MAAPVVSGLAALIMAYYPSLSAADVRQVILDSATRHTDATALRPGDGTQVQFGTLSATGAIVNAYEALKLAAERAARMN